ncbi:MAG: hypothetical protein LW835_10975 [Burkholderiaceae bacterium]|jgi:hypothetical protein|nr:hypothetical protein [Burkholderiaceae bacterium]
MAAHANPPPALTRTEMTDRAQAARDGLARWWFWISGLAIVLMITWATGALLLG